MNLLPPAAQPRLPHFIFPSSRWTSHHRAFRTAVRLTRTVGMSDLLRATACFLPWDAEKLMNKRYQRFPQAIGLTSLLKIHASGSTALGGWGISHANISNMCLQGTGARVRSSHFFRSPRYCEYYSHSQKTKIILVIDLKWQLFPLSALNINLFIINVNIYFPKSL